MVLPESEAELWVAAVWVQAQSERPAITSYYLAAVVDQPESDAI